MCGFGWLGSALLLTMASVRWWRGRQGAGAAHDYCAPGQGAFGACQRWGAARAHGCGGRALERLDEAKVVGETSDSLGCQEIVLNA